MATKYSAEVTSLRNSPPDHVDVGKLGARIRVAQGTMELATTDIDDNDVIVLTRLPANARLLGIYLFNDDLDSNGSPTLAANVGLYETDGTVIDEDEYATAITQLQSATTQPSNILFEAQDINALDNRLWEQAGETSEVYKHYDIAITISAVAATAAAGTLSYRIEYVVD